MTEFLRKIDKPGPTTIAITFKPRYSLDLRTDRKQTGTEVCLLQPKDEVTVYLDQHDAGIAGIKGQACNSCPSQKDCKIFYREPDSVKNPSETTSPHLPEIF